MSDFTEENITLRNTPNTPKAQTRQITIHLPVQLKEKMITKIQICSIPLVSLDEIDESSDKKERLKCFQEILMYFKDQNDVEKIINPHFEILMNMIEVNLFRSLPVLKKSGTVQGMTLEEESIEDPLWPYLEPVYEILLQIISKVDVKILKIYLSSLFIQNFIQLFDSEEKREREYLKNIFHKIYLKIVQRRKMIRKVISDYFTVLIHETYKFNGASDLLQVLASIISGYTTPLRQEHLQFFTQILVPLHKVQTFSLFHENLLRCSILFLVKDPSLSIQLLQGLLKYWPFANSSKEVIYISEFIQVLEICKIGELRPYIDKIFKRLIKCLTGLNIHVLDRAICFFENDSFLQILDSYKKEVFPLLIPVIHHLSENYWHKTLQQSINSVCIMLRDLDPCMFDHALQMKEKNSVYQQISDPMQFKKEKQRKEEKWKKLFEMAKNKNPQLKEPKSPYSENHVVGDFNGIDKGNVLIS